MNDAGYELTPAGPVAPTAPLPASGVLHVRPAVERAQLNWRQYLAWAGRACLILFAAVALVSANRSAGLLTIGAISYVSSALRGTVPVGVVYWLVPVGVIAWLAGRLSPPGPGRSARWRLVGEWFGPVVVSGPLVFLIALSLARLSPTLGWGDAAFVVVGLALLAITYLFVLKEQLPGRVLAGFVAVVSGLQAGVGLGQFILQRDLGLSWLGELRLDPSVSGVGVVATDATRILRAYGLMRHPNALGAILPLGLLAAISLWTRGQTRWRYFWLGMAALITTGLVVSFSRAGWLGAAAGLAVLIACSRPARKSPDGSRWRRRALPALLVTGLVVAVLVGLRPETFLGAARRRIV